MSQCAGFAALVEFSVYTAQTVVNAYYDAGVIPKRIQASTQATLPGLTQPGTLSIDFFVYQPLLGVTGVNPDYAPGVCDLVNFVFSFAGSASYSGTGGQLAGNVYVTVEGSCRVFGARDPDGVHVRFGADDVTVWDIGIDAIDQATSSTLTALLATPGVKAYLTSLVAGVLSSMPSLSPPVSVPMLGMLDGSADVTGVAVVALPNLLAIGVDLAGAGFGTAGDPAAVTDHLSKSHVWVCLNPALVPMLAASQRPSVQDQVAAAQEGAELDDFGIGIEQDYFRVDGSISNLPHDATATFTVCARPTLGRDPVYSSYEDEDGHVYQDLVSAGTDDIWLDVLSSDVDVDLPWWLDALQVVVPVLYPVIASIVAVNEANASNQLGSVSDGLSRHQSLTLPGGKGATIGMDFSMVRVDADGPRTRLTFPSYGTTYGSITSPAAGSQSQQLTCTMHPAKGSFDSADPLVRTSWQVRRSDPEYPALDNSVVLDVDRPIGDPDALTLDLSPLKNQIGSWTAKISCSIYRRLPDRKESLDSAGYDIGLVDEMSAQGPYRRWTHTAHVPLPPGSHKAPDTITNRYGQLFYSVVRHSVIHRTDPAGRCAFSRGATPSRGYRPDTVFTWLHELPFPPGTEAENRKVLCDYCFFGGPDKSVPLPRPFP